MNRALSLCVIAGCLVAPGLRADDAVVIAPAKKDCDGFLVHEVRSPYQAGTTLIRVLLPDQMEKGKTYPVIYLLPVEAGTESRYGDGLKEIKKFGLHNQFGVIFVAPTFSHLPWYADHPINPKIRQESYFLKVVVAFIDKTYPAQAEAAGRMLLGFSKSGWGAWALLLRNSGQFHKAVAWDAPMMMDRPGPYGSGDIFGTAANFENYRISKLLKDNAATFQKETRLILLGYGNFRAEHVRVHALMDAPRIAHIYRDGPARKHDWHSGWVAEAVESLFEKRRD